MVNNVIKSSVFFLLLMLCLTACSPKEKLQEIDNKLGETLFNEKESPIEVIEKDDKNKQAIDNSGQPDDLTVSLKARIDDWLKANGYNRYGDKEGTFYTGGTPLFNEATGSSTERFDYILERIPDILDRI